MSSNGHHRSSSSKRRLVDPPSPTNALTTSCEGLMNNSNMLYIIMGAAGISMAISVFLYKEMRKLKIDIETVQKKSATESKENNESNAEAIKSIESKINQLAQNMQGLHMYVRSNASVQGKPPPPTPKPLPKIIQTKPKLPKPDGVAKVVIMEGGPEKQGAVCDLETGVCEVPQSNSVQIEELSDGDGESN
jgi:cell division protein FtsL